MGDYIVFKSQKNFKRTVIRRGLTMEEAREFCQEANAREPPSVHRWWFEFTRDD